MANWLRRTIAVFLVFLLCSVSWASSNTITITGSGAPTGTCSVIMFYVDSATGNFYDCPASAWIQAGAPGGGVVTSVFGRTGAVVATTGDYAVAQVTGAAPLASPTFTGTPAAPT